MSFQYWMFTEWFEFQSLISVWDTTLSTIIVMGFSVAMGNAFLYYVPSGGKPSYVIAPSLFAAFIGLWLTRQALLQVGDGDQVYLSFLHSSLPVRLAFYFIVIVAVNVATIFYGKQKEQQEISKREATTADMVREAELQKLQLQLQPHFLFNSLNSINALILVKPDEARKMVISLSDFLRTTIKRADQHWIMLEEEWRYLQLYLEIEKVRFGHRLGVETNFQEGTFEWKIPTLLLQPIVENAIKFGLYGTTGKITIHLDGFLQDDMLHLNITNPFDTEAQPPKGSGFGLSGIKRRLYLLYARNDLLETQAHENLFTVKLKIPRTA